MKQYILLSPKFTNVYINFCPSDSGGSIGAALWAWNTFIDTSNIKIKQNVFLGPDFTDDEIQTTLLNLDIKYEKFEDQASLLNATVEDLVSNKIIVPTSGKLFEINNLKPHTVNISGLNERITLIVDYMEKSIYDNFFK